MADYREILRLSSQGISQRGIASSCRCSRNTVVRVLERAQMQGVRWPLKDGVNNGDLQQMLFPDQPSLALRKRPDYEQVHRDLAKSGVTLSLLWHEYCEECRCMGELPLMYTQFCLYYREFAQKTKATMHISRKPGEQMEVDWAGQTAKTVDADTGEEVPAHIFVAVLSSSQYAYVEAFLSQNQECWIAGHVNAFKFFGGVSRMLVPDNLRTGVQKPSWFTPEINRTYQDLAEHYGTVVMPARVRRPKDKPNAEGTVGVISTWILAALRHQRFFSLAELNEAIADKLREFNARPFQKKPGSRLSAFLEEERVTLLPLPRTHYELATWKIATVQFNYHVCVDGMFYSVPHEFIKHKVDVRITRTVVEVFFQGSRICSHARLYGREGQYSTLSEHMPEDHRKYAEWNAKRFLSWAEDIGPNAAVVIKAILSSHKIEQQGYRSCMALLKIAEKHSPERVEAACAKALTYTPRPSYRGVQTILKSGQDQLPPEKKQPSEHGFVRGSRYYGGEPKC
ncbi:MAG: IS21 family transposase [Bacillota bacterium]|jgi:transposase|nr:IS21 family transposase [Bacillota bacterium]